MISLLIHSLKRKEEVRIVNFVRITFFLTVLDFNGDRRIRFVFDCFGRENI
jgi:hypothetical protein